jgi:hypothetical protein
MTSAHDSSRLSCQRIFRPPWAALLSLLITLLAGVAAAAPGLGLRPGTRPPATAPATVPATQASTEDRAMTWQPLFRGVDFVHQHATQPRHMEIHLARIDLKAPGVRLFVDPPSAKDKRPGMADTLRPSVFLNRYKLQLAINGSPFAPDSQQDDTPVKIRGLSASDGNVYAPHDSRWGAIVITKDNRVRISMPPLDLADAYTGLAGYSLLIVEGANREKGTYQLHPRTAVGVSQDGRYLLLIVVDGRQPRVSEGATLDDLAQWLLRAGAWTALNLDGGASSTMVMAGPDGKPKVLNKPMHLGTPGLERPSGNHLGVYAEALP